jgi:protein SCO1/2
MARSSATVGLITAIKPRTETMRYLRFVRLFAWVCVGIATLHVVAMSMGWFINDGPRGTLERKDEPVIAKGGPFAMTDHRGRPFTDADLRGRPALVFFGFTSCPVICPTTLGDMTSWLEELGAEGEKLSAVFVSVDPERDDVAQMASYLEPYNQRIFGLTGPQTQLAKFAEIYRVYYKKVPIGDDNYTMDHTASVLMLDRSLNMVGTVDFHEERSITIAKLKLLLAR